MHIVLYIYMYLYIYMCVSTTDNIQDLVRCKATWRSVLGSHIVKYINLEERLQL